MDDGFKPIYDRLYKAYLAGQDPPAVLPRDLMVQNVNYAIEAIQSERQSDNKPIFREDAKHLLLTCFTEMVYKPLASNDSPIAVPANLSTVIQNDIRTIADSTKPAANQPISAQAVFNSLPSVWGRILSGAAKLWEGTE
jgi:hypothetical protein